MKLSTSTRISLQFALMTAVVVLLFSVFIRGFSQRMWQRGEKAVLQMTKKTDQMQKPGARPFQQRFLHTITLERKEVLSDFPELLRKKEGIVNKDGRRYIYQNKGNTTVLRDVTMHKQAQDDLLQSLVWGGLIIILLSFFLAKWLVGVALRDLHVLSEKVKQLHVHDMQLQMDMSHLPPGDELRIVSDALQDTTRTLAQQVADIQQFVSNVSHELRTPLMGLRSSYELAQRTRDYSAMIDQNMQTIDAMESMIQTLLLLARHDQQTLTTELVDIIPTTQAIVQQVTEQYKDKSIVLNQEFPRALQLHTHLHSWERVLQNLLDNAYKYTPEGGSITLEMSSEQCVVRDSGVGMTPEQLQHIWKPFRQADVSRGVDGGYGLGLALVKRIVDQHGWHIEVKSQPGEGTCFTLSWT